MPTVKRAGLPEFWATGIAKLLIGENPCQFEQWIKGHYRIEKVQRPDDGKLTAWRINHTEQLSSAVKRFKAEGWKCDVERYWKLTGETATIAGKADLITHKDGVSIIRDIKSGVPRDSDIAQVMIYMVCIPLAWKTPQVQFSGQVIYGSHTVEATPREASDIKSQLFALMRRLGSPDRLGANPSATACRWCDVSESDCPDRISEHESVDVLTSEF